LPDANEAEEAVFKVMSGYAGRQMGAMSQLVQLASKPRLNLLTTVYLPKVGHEIGHTREVLAALAVNVENPLIATVHVLLEAHSGNCSVLKGLMENATKRRLTRFPKVICTEISHQPTYSSLFEYANSSIPEGLVMLSNADVAFDETLALMPDVNATTQSHVISVFPPQYEGAFRDVFQEPCTHRAERQCGMSSSSWDVYVFKPPLPSRLLEYDLNFTMNIDSAEFYAAGALNGSGMKLTNPCMLVKASHWHCFSQKMHRHFPKRLLPHPPWGSFRFTKPCADFPDLKYGNGTCRQCLKNPQDGLCHA